jgi:hypothetical protein
MSINIETLENLNYNSKQINQIIKGIENNSYELLLSFPKNTDYEILRSLRLNKYSESEIIDIYGKIENPEYIDKNDNEDIFILQKRLKNKYLNNLGFFIGELGIGDESIKTLKMVESGHRIYGTMHATSINIEDLFSGKNVNNIILGMSGEGKSFSTKIKRH